MHSLINVKEQHSSEVMFSEPNHHPKKYKTPQKGIRFTSSLCYLIFFFIQEIKKWSDISQKPKGSSDLNFHVETRVHASKIQSFQEKVRNFKLAASNTFKELLESSSCRLNA